jgi:hypothetical protein
MIDRKTSLERVRDFGALPELRRRFGIFERKTPAGITAFPGKRIVFHLQEYVEFGAWLKKVLAVAETPGFCEQESASMPERDAKMLAFG